MSNEEQPVVLVVEDNPTGIASLVGILGAACELVVAKTLAEAERCLSPDMDLVLLDLYLPDGNGIEFLKRLKSDPLYQELPVICMSASDQSSDIEEAFREGAIDYVLKPFNKIILSAKVSTFVDFKRKTNLLAAQALRDTLTGIGNRRMFEQQLDLEWRRALRQELSLGLALVDMDHFKSINDQHGHAQGDVCLQLLATSMEKAFGRAGDLVARLGGDEFVAMLPGATLNSTVRAAKRLKEVLANEHEKCRRSGQDCPGFSVSVGCYAVVPHKGTNASELKEAADQYLYEAKREGGVAVSDLLSKLDRDDSIGTRLFQVKPKIMVVDDEPTNIRVLSDALKNDHDIIVATSAKQALGLLDRGERPHLLLLDIMMPDMDGLEMCRRLKMRQELQHIPVIFITALIDTDSEEKGFEVGAVDFIRKPISIPSVRARVRTHISLKGMLDHMVELNQTLNERLHQSDQLNWRLMQEQKRGRAADSTNLYEQAFMSTSEGIAVLDHEGKITAVNPSYSRITGYSEDEALGRYHDVLDVRVDKRHNSTSILDYLGVHNHWSGEIYNRRRNGEVYPELRTISTIRAEDGQVTHYVTVFNDITNLKETEQRLEELTWRDPVTGFPNRALFLDQLSTVLKLCHHGGMATAVIVVDINNFRYVNETFGFDCGDIVIQTFAERLRNACHEDDSIARLSGDEFGIVLAPKQWTLDEAYRIALQVFERIQESLREPVPYRSEGVLTIEATGGIALYPTESSDMPSLALRHAETAHRNAKDSNRAVAVFEDSMSENIRRQMAVESELARAITENEIAMYAQSQHSPDRKLAGIELLVRWDHPERGLLGPGEFIPFAERTRQIVALERHIVRVCLGMLAQMRADSRKLRCSINISAKHMAEEDFAEAILGLVADSGYPPALITFELTESVMVKDVDAVVEKMEKIRNLGCTFSLDDFGTGYSSLSQLRRLPISEIKIDRSFVLSALNDSTSADIVDMVKRIGESMNVRVVAEGVETQEHADFLKTHHPGVYLQGYFFGRPAPLWTFFVEKSH